MEKQEFQNIMRSVFQKNSIDGYLHDETIEKFHELTERMLQTNQVMNITAITDLPKIIALHYADCVKAAAMIPENAKVLDVGCGGGFPILPLAIVRPDLELVGLDSTEKKIRYVQKTADALALRVSTVSARAEDLARCGDYREQFDIVISRAVARLAVLDELCLPFVRIRGAFLPMKGANGALELQEAENGIRALGGQVEEKQEYPLYLLDGQEDRCMIRIRKIKPCDEKYPRAFGAIKKKPL